MKSQEAKRTSWDDNKIKYDLLKNTQQNKNKSNCVCSRHSFLWLPLFQQTRWALYLAVFFKACKQNAIKTTYSTRQLSVMRSVLFLPFRDWCGQCLPFLRYCRPRPSPPSCSILCHSRNCLIVIYSALTGSSFLYNAVSFLSYPFVYNVVSFISYPFVYNVVSFLSYPFVYNVVSLFSSCIRSRFWTMLSVLSLPVSGPFLYNAVSLFSSCLRSLSV